MSDETGDVMKMCRNPDCVRRLPDVYPPTLRMRRAPEGQGARERSIAALHTAEDKWSTSGFLAPCVCDHAVRPRHACLLVLGWCNQFKETGGATS